MDEVVIGVGSCNCGLGQFWPRDAPRNKNQTQSNHDDDAHTDAETHGIISRHGGGHQATMSRVLRTGVFSTPQLATRPFSHCVFRLLLLSLRFVADVYRISRISLFHRFCLCCLFLFCLLLRRSLPFPLRFNDDDPN